MILSKEEVNKTIHIAKGLCYHEWEKKEFTPESLEMLDVSNPFAKYYKYSCKNKKCNFHNLCYHEAYKENKNPDYTEWLDYGPMIQNWAMEQVWWYRFVAWTMEMCVQKEFNNNWINHHLEIILNPAFGSSALTEFLRYRGLGYEIEGNPDFILTNNLE